MAYGFDLYVSGTTREVTIIETHDGRGVNQKVREINQKVVSSLTIEEVRKILDHARETQAKITFILESGESLVFSHDSTPDRERWSPKITKQEGVNPTHPLIKSGLEYVAGEGYQQTTRLRPGAVSDAFRS